MRRRSCLTATAGVFGLSGCVSFGDRTPPGSTTSPAKEGGTTTPVRRTTDGIEATFRVVDGHRPTDDTASATFDDERVTVTGTTDPPGCDRPALTTVEYDATAGVVRLVVGTESPYGATATVECGNASFDYRSVLSAEGDQPTTVEVVHEYQGKDDQTFVLERN